MDNVDIKKQRVMTYFIEATEKLLKEDSIDGLSIRKIASEAGYNSATLYNYFEDLEHLVLFASVRYLREYISTLGQNITPKMNALEKYRTIYSTFNYFAFRSPEIFHNMFFGKYSSKLSQVIYQYYELFPMDLEGHDDTLKLMLKQGNMYLRDEPVMKELVKEKYVSSLKTQMTLDLIIRTHQSFLYEAWAKGDRIDADEHNKSFLKLFDYIMEMAH
ncbi:TetR/AcrR family transcriptional regulator [uncultured Clostridium sp.]|uniref:TetR/AcrR family transcriptional regulator n=1 Tax=uncultured Clostridium sp. TaxID=59620 RepID=UPI0028E654AE|nr:TetR/AcrR family transcriptional regulator [uncultured Clostridium sp.]